MSLQSRTFGATNFTLTTSAASGTDYTSKIAFDTTGSNISGAFIGAAFTTLRPIVISSYAHNFTTDFTGQVQLQIATAVNGSGGWEGINVEGNGTKTQNPDHPCFTNSDRWYGFQKQSSASVRSFRSGSGGSGVFEDGDLLLEGVLRATIQWKTVANAPTVLAGALANWIEAKTSRSVTLTWTKPTDLGGSTVLTGYRILYKETSSSTWLSTGKVGGNTTTSHTVTGLLPNTSYDFRIAATNDVSDRHNTSYTSIASHTGANTATITVSTYPEVSVWNGSTFSPGLAYVWNGTTWSAPANVKVWNGTTWSNS